MPFKVFYPYICILKHPSDILYRSLDFGKTWEVNRRGISDFVAFNSKVYVIDTVKLTNSEIIDTELITVKYYKRTGSSVCARSNDFGNSFKLDTINYVETQYIVFGSTRGYSNQIKFGVGSNLFLADSTIFRSSFNNNIKVFQYSKDGGLTWDETTRPGQTYFDNIPYDNFINGNYFRKSVTSAGKPTFIYGKRPDFSDSIVIPLKREDFINISFKMFIL